MYDDFEPMLWVRPEVATMKSKSLLALALTSAFGSFAWSQPYDPYHARPAPNDQPGLYNPYNFDPSTAQSVGDTNKVPSRTNPNLHAPVPPADGSVRGWDGKDPAIPKDGFDRGSGDKLYELLALPGGYGGASATTNVASTPYGAQKKKADLDGDPFGILGFNPYGINSILAPTPHSGHLLGAGAKSKSLGSLNSLLPSNPLNSSVPNPLDSLPPNPLNSLPSGTNPSLGSATLGKQRY